MLFDTLKTRLSEKFTEPLPEFYKRRIVFWCDEKGEFTEQISELTIPGVKIITLTGRNNFLVKKLLSMDDLTGNYLIYNPLVYEKMQDNWLFDIELYSEEFYADRTSMWMEELHIDNTSNMRKAVEKYVNFFNSQDRRMKLRKIGRVYSSHGALHLDILLVLCGLSNGVTSDVIVAVLRAGLAEEDNHVLYNIKQFGNVDLFWQMVQRFTGYNAENPCLAELVSRIFVTAMSQTMDETNSKGLERYIIDAYKMHCYQIVNELQQDMQQMDSVKELFHYVERKLHLSERFDNTDIDILLKCDVFPAINESLLKRFFTEISENVIKVEQILKTVENRRTIAWYPFTSDYFDCLYNIAKMQEYHLTYREGFHIVEPEGIWKMYIDDGYLMDSYYRHFHFAFSNTLKTPNALLDDLLKKCADVVEGLYKNWFLTELTRNWTNAISNDLKTCGHVSKIPKQRNFYSRYVMPPVSYGERVFVVISDALRYEVASELAAKLNYTTKGKADLTAMQTVFPSITKFGMAALLPGKDFSVNEKMDVFVDEKATNSMEKRGAILSCANEKSIVIKYADLRQMKMQERRNLLQGKEIMYIYHDIIDAIGDKLSTEANVFEACNTAIDDLSGLVKFIVNELNGTNIVITTDHGFLYTYNSLDESQKISQQTFNGEVFEIGRRYALVSQETSAEYLLPIKTESEIGGFAMKGYAPQDTVRIKIQGGGENYVHGGISLQEMVVPVIIYKNMKTGNNKYVEVTNPGLSIINESRKISNLIFSLDFLQKQPVGDKVQPCIYTLQFVDATGEPVSYSQTVIADKTSKADSERVIKIKFALKSILFDKHKLYRLVISNNIDDIIEDITFNIDVALADDFGF
jgi:uncharacterized protein (TIGR02687 family)